MKALRDSTLESVMHMSSLKALLQISELNLPKVVNFSLESFDVLGWKKAKKAINELEQLKKVHGENFPYLMGIALRETWFACLRNFYTASMLGDHGVTGGIEGGQELGNFFAYADEEGWAYLLSCHLGKIHESMERVMFREETPYEKCPSDDDILKSMAVYWFALSAAELRAGNAARAYDWIDEADEALLLVNGSEMWNHSLEEAQIEESGRVKKSQSERHVHLSESGRKGAKSRHIGFPSLKSWVLKAAQGQTGSATKIAKNLLIKLPEYLFEVSKNPERAMADIVRGERNKLQKCNK